MEKIIRSISTKSELFYGLGKSSKTVSSSIKPAGLRFAQLRIRCN